MNKNTFQCDKVKCKHLEYKTCKIQSIHTNLCETCETKHKNYKTWTFTTLCIPK